MLNLMAQVAVPMSASSRLGVKSGEIYWNKERLAIDYKCFGCHAFFESHLDCIAHIVAGCVHIPDEDFSGFPAESFDEPIDAPNDAPDKEAADERVSLMDIASEEDGVDDDVEEPEADVVVDVVVPPAVEPKRTNDVVVVAKPEKVSSGGDVRTVVVRAKNAPPPSVGVRGAAKKPPMVVVKTEDDDAEQTAMRLAAERAPPNKPAVPPSTALGPMRKRHDEMPVLPSDIVLPHKPLKAMPTIDYQCHICQRAYSSRERFIDHLNRHRSADLKQNDQCRLCGGSFATAKMRRLHEEAEHRGAPGHPDAARKRRTAADKLPESPGD